VNQGEFKDRVAKQLEEIAYPDEPGRVWILQRLVGESGENPAERRVKIGREDDEENREEQPITKTAPPETRPPTSVSLFGDGCSNPMRRGGKSFHL
jgi:hypothetical protein